MTVYTLLDWAHYLCAMVCMVSVGEWTYHWTVKNYKRILVAGIVYFTGFVFGIVLYRNSIFVYSLYYIAELAAWYIMCDAGCKNRVIKIVIWFFALSIVEFPISLFLDMILGSPNIVELRKLLKILILFLLFAIVTRSKRYQKVIMYMESISKVKIILIACVIILGTAVSAFGDILQETLQNNRITGLFRGLLVVEMVAVITIIIWLIVESYQKKYYVEQNALKEECIHAQQEYYKTIYEKDKEMRSFRHDVAHQMGMLQMLLEKGDIDSAKEQMHRINQDFHQASFLKIHVGEEMLDAILSMMNQKAAERDIELEIVGEIKNRNNWDVYDLCAIFSNAINNAIDACERLECSKTIWVKILEHNETLCCTIENPATEEMYQELLNGRTTKTNGDNHGFGIGNIKRAVERLNGSMDYHYIDGKIKLEIQI